MKAYYLLVLLSVNTYEEPMEKRDDADDMDYQDHRNCFYIPYWQCKKDFSGLIDGESDILDGIDGVDVRMDEKIEEQQTLDVSPPGSSPDLNVCCLLECGKRMNTPVGVVVKRSIFDEYFGVRILGDTEAEFAEFPWMLGILDGRTYRCGASLIHPQVALTAAHCITGKGPLTIRAGEWNWESKKEALPHQERKVQQIVKHPKFRANSLQNDIALIFLDEPFRLMQNIGVICLPQQGAVFDHAKCVAAGWGKNSHKKGTYQATLKKVTLPVVPRGKCLRALRNAALGPYYMLHQSFICAGESGKDTCKGDGGSPLMCPIAGRKGKYQQVGIVSWGLTCGRYDAPGVYVNVALFRQWIDFTLSALGVDNAVDKFQKRALK